MKVWKEPSWKQKHKRIIYYFSGKLKINQWLEHVAQTQDSSVRVVVFRWTPSSVKQHQNEFFFHPKPVDLEVVLPLEAQSWDLNFQINALLLHFAGSWYLLLQRVLMSNHFCFIIPATLARKLATVTGCRCRDGNVPLAPTIRGLLSTTCIMKQNTTKMQNVLIETRAWLGPNFCDRNEGEINLWSSMTLQMFWLRPLLWSQDRGVETVSQLLPDVF